MLPSLTKNAAADQAVTLTPLQHGQRMDQKTFHPLNDALPSNIKAELIEGVVHMAAAAMKRPHGRHQTKLISLLDDYEEETPGVEVCDNTTAILGENSEPQADAHMYIHPDCGGQVSIEDEYSIDAPELMAEVSDATRRVDLGAKKRDYEKAGVKEYVVLDIPKEKVHWFVNRGGKFEPMLPDADGIFRSEVFSGLWLDADAWLRLDGKQMRRVLAQGLNSPEHAEFVKTLEARRIAGEV